MKALTLYQPWATFIVAGLKTLETRPTKTHHRGPLVIHAGKLGYWELIDMLGEAEVARLDRICRRFKLPPVACLPRGAALGTVEVLNCGRIILGSRIDWIDKAGGWGIGHPGMLERSMGDYSVGRYAWMMIRPAPLPEPIPMSGKQGLWDVPPEAQVHIPLRLDDSSATAIGAS